MRRPKTRYARSGDLNIGYQVVGEGPVDLVYVPGWVSNIDGMWDEWRYAAFLERLASFSRLILFDKRGTGVSDPVDLDHLPALEDRMDDLRAVMDAAGSERATLLGHSEGGPMSILFAATYPERTASLILVGAYAKRIPSPDYPWAPDPVARAEEIARTEREWVPDDMAIALAPSLAGDAEFLERFDRYLRRSASPKAAAGLLRMNTQIDVRDVLPAIRVPTLLIYRGGDADVNVEEGRYLASRIPGATLLELPGSDHLMWTGDADAILDAIEGAVPGTGRAPEPDRQLATVLFTDIVGSTERAREVGDHGWTDLLRRHHEVVRSQLERWQGREIDTAGDGFFATFDGPARGVRCAASVVEQVRGLGLEIRAGLHTGEIETVPEGVRGIAVHIGARVGGQAGPSEVLVSSTVRDLVWGSGIEFQDAGERDLKGVPGPWRLYRVVST
ncbi:MAG TPA: adenylate/guanylate cyclase domain-containing protein [Actinomycetota bacterium]|nr:adenylate/guanylate cyclase domain-containing protein [Actinomycetota bacterium]